MGRCMWFVGAISALGLISGVTSVVSAAPPPAPAEETDALDTVPNRLGTQPLPGDRLITMKEFIVTAIGSEAAQFKVPYATGLVTREQMDERQYRTVPQALRDEPGVMVQETSVGQGSPYIRGFTGFRNLFLVDGVRLNNSVFRDGPNQYWNTLDGQIVDRLEVVKGPSSVLYGSDAIGGTVNAITRNPYAYGEGANVGGRGYYRFASAEESHAVRGEVSVGVDDELGFVGGGTYRNFGNLHTGGGTQGNTGYAEWHADFKAEFFLEEDVRLVVANQMTRQNNVPRTHKTVFALPFEGTTIGTDLKRDLDQERHLVYVQLHAEQMEGAVREVHASISWQRQSEVQDRIKGSGSRELQGLEVNTLGLFVTAVSETAIGELTYGLDYYRDWVNSFSSDNPIQGPVADDASYDLLGLFVQDRIVVSEDFEIYVGGRFTWARAQADSVNVNGKRRSLDEDWFNFSGSGRFVWFIGEEQHWNIFGGVSQGFRAPNLSDLTRDADFGGGVEKPAPDLDPETFVMFELGTKAEYDDFEMQAAVFYYLIQDQILRVPSGVGGVFNKINSDDGYLFGVELGAAWQFAPAFTLFGNIAWLEGKEDSVLPSGQRFDDYISRLMPLMGQVGVRYDWQEHPVWVELVMHWALEADRLSLRDQSDTERIPPGGTPGYVVGTIRGGWRFHENASLVVAIENFTDENYRVHGSGQNMPGLNVVASVEVRF